jgi:putative ABC transport system ATP-binding protein
MDILLDLNRENRTTLIIVTHDPDIADRAEKKLVIRDGLAVE